MGFGKRFGIGSVARRIGIALNEHPVEILLAACYCALAIYQYWCNRLQIETFVDKDRLSVAFLLAPIVLSAAFLAGWHLKRMPARIVYWLMPLLFAMTLAIPPKILTAEVMLRHSFYPIWLTIAALVLVSHTAIKDNAMFVSNIIGRLWALILTAVVAGVIYGLFAGITASVFYIFDLESPRTFSDIITNAAMLIFMPVAVTILFALLGKYRNVRMEAGRAFEVIVNYILTPALLIYTAILYVYFIKIAVIWELPKGGIAYMVFAYAILAVGVKALQTLLDRHPFGWFFDRFHWISLPLLAMFWIGCAERISSYGLTPWRISMLICGVAMSFFVLMFFCKRYAKYLYGTLFMIAVLLPFAVVPGLDFESVSARSQMHRLDEALRRLDLLSPQGMLLTERRPDADSVRKDLYSKAYEAWNDAEKASRSNSERIAKKYSGDDEELYERIYSSGKKMILSIAPQSMPEYYISGAKWRSDDNETHYTFTGGGVYAIDGEYETIVNKGITCDLQSGHTLKISVNDVVVVNIPKDEFVRRQLEKTGHPAIGFDESYLTQHESEFLEYDNDTCKVLLGQITLNYNLKTGQIRLGFVSAKAVLFKGGVPEAAVTE